MNDQTHLMRSHGLTNVERKTSYCGIYKPRYEVHDEGSCQCQDCLVELRIDDLPEWVDLQLIRDGAKVVTDKSSYMNWIETIIAATTPKEVCK